MDDLFDLKDKCIAITGGAGVLCGEMAVQLARCGAKVAVIDFNLAGASELCKRIEGEGNFAIPVEADVLSRR